MGRLDQYAKEVFAEETPAVTHGGAAFRPPTELNLSEVRLDGSLLVQFPDKLSGLAPPWCLTDGNDEIALEIKMQGEHLGMHATERGLLRRQARQVQRMENRKVPWEGDLPFWMAASHVPAVLRRRRNVVAVAPGCYRIEPAAFQFLWVAANELPLCDELVPFLIARTGQALETFARWIKDRRPPEWVSRMVKSLPMSMSIHEDLLRFVLEKTDDPEIQAKQKLIAKVYVDMTPEVKNEVKAAAKAEIEAEVKAAVEAAVKAEVEAEARKAGLDEGRKAGLDEGRLSEARSLLRRVLARRKVALGAGDLARVEACADLATLERWIEQAVEAKTASEALRAPDPA